MNVSRVEIENIKGIVWCELKLAGRALTVLTGANASGKTSILDAIASVFRGGSDPSLVRQGAKTGKVVIELSDGTIIKKAQSAKGTQLSVTTADGEVVKSPQAYIDSLNASFAFDPLAFIKAPKKDRSAFLIKAMPLVFTGADLHGLRMGQIDVAGPLRAMVARDAKLNLVEFEKLRLQVYEKRRNANVAVKELESGIISLRRGIPEDSENEPALHDELLLARQKMANLVERGEADIAEIRKDAESARSVARKRLEEELAEIKTEEDRAVEEVHAEGLKAATPLQRRIGELEGSIKRMGEAEALRAHLAQQQDKLAERADEADTLDRALGALDELKRSKTDSLPIAGLELREDGEVYRGGIPFDQLNQAQQYWTSFEIASLATGDLPLVIADTAETMDESNLKEFYAAVEASGMQVIVARVDEGPLRSDPQGALKL
jgi:hypothetical protein